MHAPPILDSIGGAPLQRTWRGVHPYRTLKRVSAYGRGADERWARGFTGRTRYAQKILDLLDPCIQSRDQIRISPNSDEIFPSRPPDARGPHSSSPLSGVAGGPNGREACRF